MLLREAILAAGMTPPDEIPSGRWVRFPGAGKKRPNNAGWCRVIMPTLAIFGDFSTGLSAIWRDNDHKDTAESRRLLQAARKQERKFDAGQVKRARDVELEARRLILEARASTHPYLAAKGFPNEVWLVNGEHLIVPIRAVEDYDRVLSVEKIAPDGTKRFLRGGRTKGGIFRLGPHSASHTALCEGLATGLSLRAAFELLPGPWAIVVCFSASNMVAVSSEFPKALVCADHDAESGTGQLAARKTGLKWVMPPEPGDFNDMHQRLGIAGLHQIKEILRGGYV